MNSTIKIPYDVSSSQVVYEQLCSRHLIDPMIPMENEDFLKFIKSMQQKDGKINWSKVDRFLADNF